MEIQIFQTADGTTEVDVRFVGETAWLTQEQLSELFERDRTVIGRHIRNIFNEGELDEEVVCANFARTTKHGAIEGKSQTKSAKYYNLDVIISVGYRVKSIRGTQFRQWASQRLKDYLLKGYVLNKKRLTQSQEEILMLKSGIQILSRAIEEKSKTEGLAWLANYSIGLKLLDDYDHESLDSKGRTTEQVTYPTLEQYKELIDIMKEGVDSELFGFEKDKSFESAISQITKGLNNTDFYPSFEEKAAMLLYLIIKNHAFTDGNKRIAAACFLLFLKENSTLLSDPSQPVISNDALASLTLFVASSNPDEMETTKRLIISILNRCVN